MIFIYLLNRDTIRKLLEQKLFDVHSAILNEAGEPNKHVPKNNIQEYQYEESDYSVGKNFGTKEQGIFFRLIYYVHIWVSLGNTFVSKIIN